MDLMLETALRPDALTAVPGGFELRLGLPWIRSMPLSCVSGLTVALDGSPLPPRDLKVVLGVRCIPACALEAEAGWWFVQDRLVLAGRQGISMGEHDVAVGFQVMVPYLQGRPDSPLVLPFHVEARLEAGGAPLPGVSRDVA